MPEILIVLSYTNDSLVEGGTARCEPSTPDELVEELREGQA